VGGGGGTGASTRLVALGGFFFLKLSYFQNCFQHIAKI